MNISADLLRDAIWDDLADSPIELLDDQITGKSRWSDIHTMTFKFEGKYYQTEYRTGSNESSEERPFDYVNEVECEEVKPVEKTTIVYEPID